jgi:sulfoxide reductase heme-binding subunit YedZ
MVLKKKPNFALFQILIHIGSILPFLFLAYDYLFDRFFRFNIQQIEYRTGRLAIIWLLLSLTSTPIFKILGFGQAIKVRKTLGRYSFFYALLHVFTYFVLDYALNFRLILQTLGDTVYIIFGALSFTILLALAVTSNKKAMVFLKKNWKRLHRFVYLAGIMAVIHWFLIVKADFRNPILAATALVLLLILRVPAVQDFLSIRKREKKIKIYTKQQEQQ